MQVGIQEEEVFEQPEETVAPQEVTFDVTTAEEAPTAEMQVEMQEAELTEEQITEGVVLQPEEEVAPQEVTTEVTLAEEAPTTEMQVGIQEAELTQEQITEEVFEQPEETVAPQEVTFDVKRHATEVETTLLKRHQRGDSRNAGGNAQKQN